jgi:hypothetical protein
LNNSACGDVMHHDWIFDVLTDLRSYAHRNGLVALAGQVDLALKTAAAEIAGTGALAPRPGDSGPDGAPPRRAN